MSVAQSLNLAVLLSAIVGGFIAAGNGWAFVGGACAFYVGAHVGAALAEARHIALARQREKIQRQVDASIAADPGAKTVPWPGVPGGWVPRGLNA